MSGLIVRGRTSAPGAMALFVFTLDLLSAGGKRAAEGSLGVEFFAVLTRIRTITVLFGGGALTAIGVAAWLVLRAHGDFDTSFPDFMSEDVRRRVLAREAEWLTADFDSILQPPQSLAQTWASSVLDPDSLLNERQRNDLLQLLAAHVHAIGQSTPEAYLAMAATQPQHRWRSGEVELRASFVYGVYSHSFGREPDIETQEDLVEALRAIWADVMIERGHRIVDVGVGPDGALFSVRRLRTSAPANGLEELSSERRAYWDDVPMHGAAVAFRTAMPVGFDPGDPSDDYLSWVLQDHTSAVVVFAHVLVRQANGNLACWESDWVLDPGSGVWVCNYMGKAGGRPVRVLF